MLNPGNSAVSVTRAVVASRADVWAALLRAEQRELWWPGVEVETRVGGAIVEAWRDSAGVRRYSRGTIRRLAEQAVLEFEWMDDDWRQPSIVRILVEDAGEGTRVTVTEFGLDGVSDDPAISDSHRQGWEMHLSDLGAFVGGRT
ncbi:SRPBCC domain-containing protein [Actinomycetes bacterium KLBMP 9759]